MAEIANYQSTRVGGQPEPHIIDVLIEERAPTLSKSPFWPVLKPLLFTLLSRNRAVDMANAIADHGGVEALEFIRRLLDIKVTVSNLESLPARGPVVAVANHPTGIVDGIALFDAFAARRPDFGFYANADAERVAPGFAEVLIPVEWEQEKRTREKTRRTLLQTRDLMDAGKLLIIFPAGRLSRRRNGQIRDLEWMSSAVSVARKHKAILVPVHMAGPYSVLFHAFDKFSKELRDMTLFYELLNKRGAQYQVTLGQPIAPEALQGDPQSLTEALKDHVELILPRNPNAPFAVP